ncbi:MAG: helix-turn-helix domain-containing protein, partial [Pseudomonadota bacterium]
MSPTPSRRGRGRSPGGNPNPVDIHVGSRVRQRRTLLGMSQSMLGKALGLTFQQVQKYERGTNRVGASRLYDLTRVLDVPVTYFFADMAPETPDHARPRAIGLNEAAGAAYQADPMARRETLELVRNYYRIADPNVRKRLFEMAKT